MSTFARQWCDKLIEAIRPYREQAERQAEIRQIKSLPIFAPFHPYASELVDIRRALGIQPKEAIELFEILWGGNPDYKEW